MTADRPGTSAAVARAFESVLAPHLDSLWRTAYRFTGRHEDAEDLLQELFTRLYPRYEQLTAVLDPRSWLLRSLYHLYVERHRRWLRNVLSRSDSDRAQLEAIESDAPGPERGAETDSLRCVLVKVLTDLAPEQRAVVVLHDIEGLTLAELHVRLGIPIGTLKSRLFRGRERLRRQLGNLLAGTGVLMGKGTVP